MSRHFLSKIIALLAGLIILVIAYNHNNNSVYTLNGNAYGTSWNISSTEYIGDHHRENIIEIINRIDQVASNYKNNSEIAIINQNDERYQFISNDLFKILSIADDVTNISEGYYNIMLGKISSNMGFSPTFNNELLHEKDSSYKLNEKNRTLEKVSSNWFDLSSIAKGFAVQEIHNYLIKQGLVNHLIDIGGEIIVNGSNNNDSWKIGIQDPYSFSNSASKIIENTNKKFLAVATSGEYRNYKILNDGSKITHTLNPKTLLSVDNNILSVTVIHESSATYADAFATAFNAMGPELAIKIANKNDIALMLIIEFNNELEFIYSNKWYDLAV